MESTDRADERAANLELWNNVFHTHPDRVTKISGGRLGAAKLSSVDPQYVIFRATEQWGPLGGRWWTEQRDLKLGQKWCYVRIWLWFPVKGGQPVEGREERYGRVEQWGGSLMAQGSEAPKSAYTNAVKKALSWLGFAGDLHSGRHDDPAYVQRAAQSLTPAGHPVASQQPAPAQQQQQQQQQQDDTPEPPPDPNAPLDDAAKRRLGQILSSFEQEHEVARPQCQALANGWAGRQILTPEGIGSLTYAERDRILSGLQQECLRRLQAASSGAPGSAPAPTGAYPQQSWQQPAGAGAPASAPASGVPPEGGPAWPPAEEDCPF